MKAENLAGHVAKVHPNAPPSATSWRGTDYRVVRSLIVVAALAAIACLVVVIGLNTTSLALGVAIMVPTLLGLIAGLGTFSAKLSLDGDSLVLRHTFYLLAKRVNLSARLLHGPLVGSSPTVPGNRDYNQPVTEFKKGWYLQVGSIRIGCAAGDNMRQHWTGFEAGKKRVYADIVIDRKAMVDLEYTLAARGMLTSVDAAG